MTDEHSGHSELEAIFQILPDLYFRMDADGTILDYRGRQSSDFYIPLEKCIGRRMQAALPAEVGALFGEKLSEYQQSGELLNFQYSLLIDGQLRHFEARLGGLDDRKEVVVIVRDITEETARQRTLEESEQRFHATFEQAAVGLAHVASDGSWLRVNDKLCEIVGYSRNELQQMTFQDITHPDHLDDDSRALRQLLAREREQHVTEKRYIRKDGSNVWVNLTVSLRRNDDGSLRHFISVVEDIDARKRLEALQVGEHAILELISQGQASLKTVLEAITHFSESQYTGLRCTICLLDGDTLHNGAALSFPAAYNALIEGLHIGPSVGSCGTAAYRKQRVVVADVTTDPLWAEMASLGLQYGFRACWSQPVLDAMGEVLGTFSLYHEQVCKPGDDEIQLIEAMARLVAIAIERERTLGALQVSERRFRAIFEQAGVGVRVAETASGRFLSVNQCYCDIVGYTPEELIGSTYMAVTHPDDLRPGFEQLKQLEAGAISEFTMEKRYLHKAGHTLWVRLTVTNAGKLGQTTHSNIAVVEDITRHKRLQVVQAGERRILELISRGAVPLVEIFNAIILFAEEQCPGFQGAVFRREGQHLIFGAGSSLPESYAKLVDSWVEIGPAAGSCGTAVYRKERVIVTDIATDPLWSAYRALGEQFEFQTCWAEPVIDSRNEVLGAFSLYHSEQRAPDADEIELIETMARLAAIAIEREQTGQKLESAETEWLQAMDHFADVIYLLDSKHCLLRANSTFYRIIGASPAESLGHPIIDILGSLCGEKPCSVCQPQGEVFEGAQVIEAHDPCNPLKRPAEMSSKVIRARNGEPSGYLVSFHDLTRARQLEQRLRLSATVFESTAEGVIITNTDGEIVDVNRAFSEITGFSRVEVLGKNPSIWKSGRHDESFYRDMWLSLKESGHWRGEIWNRRKNGELFPEWTTISSVLDEQNRLTHYVAVFSDISALKQTQEKLEHLAHYDALTELPNRLLFNARLAHALKHAKRNDEQLAVLFLDLDRFKNVNDSLGHPMGDELLRQISGRIKGTLRQEDTVARLGGDEFVLLLENIRGPHNAALMAEKLMGAVEQPIMLEAQPVHMSVSMGISIYPDDSHDAAGLVRNADAAMYRAKEAGRNTYQFYTPELTSNAFDRVAMESDLWQAMTRDELYLVYQPQVELLSGRIIGVEALIRWRHPTLGIVSPMWFIPVAEECGLINSMGEWVLNTACAQGRQWLDKGLNFGRIAVNLSAKQLQHSGLISEVKEALIQSGLAASQLELEVTENCIMGDVEQAINELTALKELGVFLAIDDFGTGYSSLSYLKRLPLNKLKIDQSFVRDIPNEIDDMAIANAVIALGKSLSLAVIAEGVETKEQADFLKQAGCEEAQGYLYSRPITAAEVTKLLAD